MNQPKLYAGCTSKLADGGEGLRLRYLGQVLPLLVWSISHRMGGASQ